jgi:tetratricopeptide (TPR) repeat protein
MEKLETDFAQFIRQRAEQLAPGLDWEKPDWLKPPGQGLALRQGHGPAQALTNTFLPMVATNELADDAATNSAGGIPYRPLTPSVGGSAKAVTDSPEQWAAKHPTNFYALTETAERLLEQKKFEQAKAPLQKLVELYPTQKGSDCAWAMLASVHRTLGETNSERQVLARFAEQDDEAIDAYARLMELGAAAQDWPAVSENARRYLAVNPLVTQPYRSLAQASEHTSDSPTAILSYRALLQLNPLDPAEVHFRLAQLLHRNGDPEAKRHVLQALEEAPRYRAALRLLLEIKHDSPQTKSDTGTTVAASAASP